MKMQGGAERFGAKSIYGDVQSVRLEGTVKEIVTDSETLYAKTVVIATGANPRALGIEGEESLIGRGLHYCAHCDGRFYKGKTVLVVGGGNSAASDALYLSRLAARVIVVHRRDTLRATKIYHAPLMGADNVDFLWNSRIKEWLVEDGRLVGALVEDLQTGACEELRVDGAFVSIGREPATAFLGGSLALDAHGYVVADESTRTAIDGVYAVGDVRTKVLRQVVTAVGDGAVAAHYAEEYLAV
jgi:thioredoxin reductase (NADPH)